MSSVIPRLAAGVTAVVLGTVGVVSVSAPAEAAVAKGTCTVSTKVWNNDNGDLVNTAKVNCNGAKNVKIRSRLYYCSWYEGSSRKYVVKESKSWGPKKLSGKKEVAVVHSSNSGRWYGEAYVWYDKNNITYAKNALKFVSVGSPPSGSNC